MKQNAERVVSTTSRDECDVETQNSQNHCYFVGNVHILLEHDVENLMSYRAKQPAPNGDKVQFPPEADSDFDVVSTEEIATWQKKLNERFGLGQGRLVTVHEVETNG